MEYISKYKKYKNKYLELKGGASLFNNFDKIKSLIDKERFNSGFVTLRGKTFFQIIDNKYNKRYLINKTFDYFFLYNHRNNYIYLFNKNGEQIYLYSKNSESNEIMERMLEIKNNSKNSIEFLRNFKYKNILHHYINEDYTSCFKINLSTINFLLNILNKKLKKICDTLYLKLDNYYNLDGDITIFTHEIRKDTDYYMLCLYNNNNCISSIYFYFNDDYNLIMFSKTNDAYLGKNYFTLLHSVIIILASNIICNSKSPKKIINRAQSENDALILMSNFDVIIDPKGFDDLDKIKKDTLFESYNLEKRIMLLYSHYIDAEIDIEITINKKNIEKADTLFIILTNVLNVNSIKCPI